MLGYQAERDWVNDTPAVIVERSKDGFSTMHECAVTLC